MDSALCGPRRYVTEAGAAAAMQPLLPVHSGLTLPTVLLASLGDPPPAAVARSAGPQYVEVGSRKKRSQARAADGGGARGSAACATSIASNGDSSGSGSAATSGDGEVGGVHTR